MRLGPRRGDLISEADDAKDILMENDVLSFCA